MAIERLNCTYLEKCLMDALRQIVNLDEADCEKYVARADSIALDALIRAEHTIEDMDNG